MCSVSPITHLSATHHLAAASIAGFPAGGRPGGRQPKLSATHHADRGDEHGPTSCRRPTTEAVWRPLLSLRALGALLQTHDLAAAASAGCLAKRRCVSGSKQDLPAIDAAVRWSVVGLVVGGCLRTRHALERFAVLVAGLLQHIRGKLGARRRFVPVERIEIITHELLVEAGWTDADLIAVDGPES